ncbi:hypothetical protein QYM36_000307 [Artemia franciscana]|uniref:Uncharacterized protein n=1 Tax=Artemia franciscana TaxID=6661 RepID=A0AA88LG98_ARTSF|nr:hypothetical protein QYM36_000307 [Artemia franciscana]
MPPKISVMTPAERKQKQWERMRSSKVAALVKYEELVKSTMCPREEADNTLPKMERANRVCDALSYTVYDPEPSETAVEGPSELVIANTNEEKDDNETLLKAPTGGFQHKHLMAGMFITVTYEVKGKRGSMCEKVYVGMIDTLPPPSVEVIFLRKAGVSLCCFKFHANDRDEIELSRVAQILPSPVIDGKSFSFRFPCQITSGA